MAHGHISSADLFKRRACYSSQPNLSLSIVPLINCPTESTEIYTPMHTYHTCHTNIQTYTHIHAYAYTHILTHIQTFTHMYTDTHTNSHIYTHISPTHLPHVSHRPPPICRTCHTSAPPSCRKRHTSPRKSAACVTPPP